MLFKNAIFLFIFYSFLSIHAGEVSPKHLAPKSLGNTLYSHRPKTAAEAIALFQQYAKESPRSSSVETDVKVRFYLVDPQDNGWRSLSESKNDPFYGKILPPLQLQNGQQIVPFIGQLYDNEIEADIYTPLESIKPLLSFLANIKDSQLQNFMEYKQMSLENLLNLKEDDLREEIPGALLFYAEKELWNYLFSRQIRKIQEIIDYFNDDGSTHLEMYEARLKVLKQEQEQANQVLEQIYRNNPHTSLWEEGLGNWDIRTADFRGLHFPLKVLRNSNSLDTIYTVLTSKKSEWSTLVDLKEIEPLNLDLNNSKAKDLKIRVRPFSEEQLQEIGFKPILDSQSRPIEMNFKTFDGVVGRLAFLHGDGGLILGRRDGQQSMIQSTVDLLQTFLNGEEIHFLPGRIDFKALGTRKQKIRSLHHDDIQITFDSTGVVEGVSFQGINTNNNNFDFSDNFMSLENPEGSTSPLTHRDLLSIPGAFPFSRYQIGFPSPSGIEIDSQVLDNYRSQNHFLELGGSSSNYSFATLPLTIKEQEFSATLRFTPSFPENHLRLTQALAEYQRDPSQSILQSWKDQGILQEKVEEFFSSLGENQRALLASGKVWLHLGQQIVHTIKEGQFEDGKPIPLRDVYYFFLDNTDLSGSIADLGDFLSYEEGMNNLDIQESFAFMFTFLGQWLTDLQKQGLIEKDPQWEKKLFQTFLNSFAPSPINLPNNFSPPTLDEVSFIPQTSKNDSNQNHQTLKHENFFQGFDLFLSKVISNISSFIEPYWPIILYAIFIRNDIGDTQPARFSPYTNSRRIQKLIKTTEKKLGPQDIRNTIHWKNFPGGPNTKASNTVELNDLPPYVTSFRSIMNYSERKTISSSPILESLASVLENFTLEASPDFLENQSLAHHLSQEVNTLSEEYPRIGSLYNDIALLLIGLDQAFRKNSQIVIIESEEISLQEAIARLNTMRKSLDDPSIDDNHSRSSSGIIESAA